MFLDGLCAGLGPESGDINPVRFCISVPVCKAMDNGPPLQSPLAPVMLLPSQC
jgi:hypothetical protein